MFRRALLPCLLPVLFGIACLTFVLRVRADNLQCLHVWPCATVTDCIQESGTIMVGESNVSYLSKQTYLTVDYGTCDDGGTGCVYLQDRTCAATAYYSTADCDEDSIVALTLLKTNGCSPP